MVRIPKDPDNITPDHVDRAIEDALKKYEHYENRVDFTWPQERIDELYHPYQLACELCKDLRSYALVSQRKLIDHLP